MPSVYSLVASVNSMLVMPKGLLLWQLVKSNIDSYSVSSFASQSRLVTVFNVCTVSLQSFDITPPKSFLSIIIIIIIIKCRTHTWASGRRVLEHSLLFSSTTDVCNASTRHTVTFPDVGVTATAWREGAMCVKQLFQSCHVAAPGLKSNPQLVDGKYAA